MKATRTSLGIIPNGFFPGNLRDPGKSLAGIEPNTLPESWNAFPHPVSTQQLGDIFIKQGIVLALKVSSVVVPGDFNFLLNPQHKLINKVKLVGDPVPFPFDVRI